MAHQKPVRILKLAQPEFQQDSKDESENLSMASINLADKDVESLYEAYSRMR